MTNTDTSGNWAAVPFELYPHISKHVDNKDDLIALAIVSPRWRVEAESILWESVSIHYDDNDEDNINKMEFLIARGATYVKHLDLDYAYTENAHRNDVVEHSEQFIMAIRCISLMDHVEQIDIYCNGEMAALILSPRPPIPAFPSLKIVHTVKYMGSCSPSLYEFLHGCSNLESLRFSNNLEPNADYSLLYNPPRTSEIWNALTTFSGNVYHVAAILRSPTVSHCLKNLTIHLQPYAVDIRTGFEGVPPAPGVECLGLGDFAGYPPFALDHVLRDLSDALAYFPNLRKVQRAPFYEKLVCLIL